MVKALPRRYTWLGVAIIVVGLIIFATILVSSELHSTVTSVSTIVSSVVSTTTITSTATISTTITSSKNLSNGPLFYSSVVSPEGLQLHVTLNSSSMQSPGAVTVQIDLQNTLDRNVTLAALTNQNMSGWNAEDFLCSENPSSSLVGFALFDGHFSAGNISAAGPPLQLGPPLEPPCPFEFGINETIFLPNSDKTMSSYLGQTGVVPGFYPVTAEVNATTGYCFGSGTSIDCPASSGLFGYWTPGPLWKHRKRNAHLQGLCLFLPGTIHHSGDGRLEPVCLRLFHGALTFHL